MDTARLIAMLAGGESGRVEFERVAGTIARDVCAFLNTDGGTVLCGVTDDGEPVGVEPRVVNQAVADALQKIEPPPRFELSTIEVAGVTVAAVAPGHGVAHA